MIKCIKSSFGREWVRRIVDFSYNDFTASFHNYELLACVLALPARLHELEFFDVGFEECEECAG